MTEPQAKSNRKLNFLGATWMVVDMDGNQRASGFTRRPRSDKRSPKNHPYAVVPREESPKTKLKRTAIRQKYLHTLDYLFGSANDYDVKFFGDLMTKVWRGNGSQQEMEGDLSKISPM
jgi:hypothetical protein